MIVLYILGGLVGAFFVLVIGMRIMMVSKAKNQEGKPVPDLGGKPGKWVKKGKPALFYRCGDQGRPDQEVPYRPPAPVNPDGAPRLAQP